MSPRLLAPLAAAALVLGLLGTTSVTLARFADTDTAAAQFGTATLEPPTNLAGSGGRTVSLTWTPSTSGWASGYTVFRSATSGSGYAAVGSVTPVGATGAGDNPANGTWYYVLRTTHASWTSVTSNEVSVVVGPSQVTTPARYCSSNAPETVNAGDNNGFDTNPGRACGAPDDLYATDTNSGTGTTNSCTSAAKDRHRFWGYTFGLPAGITSVDGITVTPRAGMGGSGGTSWVCVQLSSDGGATWTTPKQVVLSSSALTTYSLGGSSDTWGRTWAADDLGSTFRVRVINSSTQGSKDFRLDSIGVSVTYRP